MHNAVGQGVRARPLQQFAEKKLLLPLRMCVYARTPLSFPLSATRCPIQSNRQITRVNNNIYPENAISRPFLLGKKVERYIYFFSLHGRMRCHGTEGAFFIALWLFFPERKVNTIKVPIFAMNPISVQKFYALQRKILLSVKVLCLCYTVFALTNYRSWWKDLLQTMCLVEMKKNGLLLFLLLEERQVKILKRLFLSRPPNCPL